MSVILYGTLGSQPTRAVLLFCKLNNIPVELKNINLLKLEHRSPEYTNLNPFALIPVLEDKETGFVVNESHAILKYLHKKFNVSEKWYPSDLQQNARIEAYLSWHHSNTRPMVAGYLRKVMLGPYAFGSGKPSAKEAESSLKALLRYMKQMDETWLNFEKPGNTSSKFLNYKQSKGGKFIAGMDAPTIADLSCYCELAQLNMLPDVEQEAIYKNFARVREWMKLMETVIPGVTELNTKGLDPLKKRILPLYLEDKKQSKL